MIIKPMIRSNICINSHPAGCSATVLRQIDYARGQADAIRKAAGESGSLPKLALIVGCSTGYGLASRVITAFGCGAATVGVSFEKSGTAAKPGTPGWYNNLRFDAEAAASGLASRTLNGDAFSREVKADAIAAVRETAEAAGIPPLADLEIYSLASPVRLDPATGVLHRSVIKPLGAPYTGRTFDMVSGAIGEVSVAPATEEEAAATVKVMGGEDWELWMDALAKAGVLAPGCRTVAYTYIGPQLSWGIYKNGTIGRAKEDLERAAAAINRKFAASGSARAYVSVNKAVVTRASAVIPIIPLYIACLFKVMKEKCLHEGCAEQIARLFRERLYTAEAASDPAKVPVDEAGRIRIDDLEMRPDVQAAVAELLSRITEANIASESDIAGFRHDFLEAHGFDVEGVDYGRDIDPSGV
jgi:enoyl-[acyl-carrier protein] reductase/trans-2-enoyl-CoA reductase (NAD+)